jgi:hypothetical protein
MPVAYATALASPATTEVPASRMFLASSGPVVGAGLDLSRLVERLAGDGGGVHLQTERFNHAAVGRNIISLLEYDHIAGDDLL